MRNKRTIFIIILAIVVAAAAIIFFAVKGNDSNTNPSSMNMSGQSSTKKVDTNTVGIQNFAYSPMAITVKVGTTVTWTNKDTASHTITSDSGSAAAFDSGTLATGQTYTHTFNKTGTFAYHCIFHSDMHGSVTVTK